MNQVTRLHDLAASLDRFRQQVETVLSVASQEVSGVEDDLAEHAGNTRRQLGRARDEGASWSECEELEQRWEASQRLHLRWQHARGAYDDQARRLWRFLEEKLPSMRISLQTAVVEQEPEDSPAATPATMPSPAPVPQSTPAVPVRTVAAVVNLNDPAKEAAALAPLPVPPPPPAQDDLRGGPTPAGSRSGAAETAPLRRQVPSTTDDLRLAWRSLQGRWLEMAAGWRTPARSVFEGEQWQPVEAEVQATIRQMEQLGEATDDILRQLR